MTTVIVHGEDKEKNTQIESNKNSLATAEKYKGICIKELEELESCKKEKNIKECELFENLYTGCLKFKSKKA